MEVGRVPGQSDILVAWPAGNVPVSRPAYESGLKPSLATTHAKAFTPCDRDPLWNWGKDEGNVRRGDGSSCLTFKGNGLWFILGPRLRHTCLAECSAYQTCKLTCAFCVQDANSPRYSPSFQTSVDPQARGSFLA